MFSREQNILYSVYRIFIQGERDRQRETQRGTEKHPEIEYSTRNKLF